MNPKCIDKIVPPQPPTATANKLERNGKIRHLLRKRLTEESSIGALNEIFK